MDQHGYGKPKCTGISATWCPRCGACACAVDAGSGWNSGLTVCRTMVFVSAPSCPLHGLDSKHPREDTKCPSFTPGKQPSFLDRCACGVVRGIHREIVRPT